MNPILKAGVIIVNFALIAYTISIILLMRKKIVGLTYLWFLTVGVILDITATVCMVIGAGKGIITVHGIIGYTALFAMITDMILCYRQSIIFGIKSAVNPKLKSASLIIYIYWIVAYISGAIVVSIR